MGNGNVHRIKVLLASLLSVIAAIADIYIIVNAPHNYVLLGVISVILLIAVYLVISGKMQLRDWNNLKREEEYKEIITSQKACYLQVRRSFRETSGKISELDKKIAPIATAGEVNHQKISGLLDALMQDQKKVAKLTVSRSKENANAIMNSNDKVMEEMLKMKEALDNMVEQTGDKKEDNQSEEFAKAEERQQELLAKMQQLEDSLKGQIETITDKIQNIPEMEKELVQELKSEITEKKEPLMEEPEPETIMEEVKLEPESVAEEIMPEPVIEDMISNEIIPEEAITEETITEEPVTEELTSIEEELVTEEPTLIEEEPVTEEPISIEEEAVTEEPISIEEEAAAEELTSVEEEIAAEEPTPIADANKIMTPEDIAALIAGVGGEEEVLSDTIEEPEEEEEPSVEDVAMPDLSDLNRKMTPEDIAALIANM